MSAEDRARLLKEVKERGQELTESEIEAIKHGDVGHGFGHIALH